VIAGKKTLSLEDQKRVMAIVESSEAFALGAQSGLWT
jgi:hypothetical protein